MTIKHLKTLVAVADHRTFSEAAEAVFLTHAAVSQQMRALESELGITVFDRNSRTPVLTSTGRALVEKARILIHDYDNLVPGILDEDNLFGEVELGVVPTTLTGLAPAALRLLKDKWPKLHLRIRPGLTAPLLSEVGRNRLDAAVVTHPVVLPVGFDFLPIAIEPLQLIASEQSHSDDPIHLLKIQPFIRFNREAVVGTQIESWIQSQGVNVNEAMELDNLDAISTMVFANLGVSIVPRCCVKAVHAPPLKWIDLGPSGPSRKLGLAYKADTPKLRVITEVHKALIDGAEA